MEVINDLVALLIQYIMTSFKGSLCSVEFKINMGYFMIAVVLIYLLILNLLPIFSSGLYKLVRKQRQTYIQKQHVKQLRTVVHYTLFDKIDKKKQRKCREERARALIAYRDIDNALDSRLE